MDDIMREYDFAAVVIQMILAALRHSIDFQRITVSGIQFVNYVKWYSESFCENREEFLKLHVIFYIE